MRPRSQTQQDVLHSHSKQNAHLNASFTKFSAALLSAATSAAVRFPAAGLPLPTMSSVRRGSTAAAMVVMQPCCGLNRAAIRPYAALLMVPARRRKQQQEMRTYIHDYVHPAKGITAQHLQTPHLLAYAMEHSCAAADIIMHNCMQRQKAALPASSTPRRVSYTAYLWCRAPVPWRLQAP